MHFVWQLLALWLCLFLGRVWTANPLEQMALGALSVGTQMMDTLQTGSKASKQFNVEMPLMKLQSKTEMGYGNAMRPSSVDDSDESDERRRRRRRRKRSGNNDNQLQHLVAHRGKRSPCFKQSMATAEPTDDVDARRRAAARKRAANNSARSRVVRTMGKKKKKLQRRRRRRQAMQSEDPLATNTQQQGPTLGQRVKGLWMSFVDNVLDAVQQMRQKIKAAANQATQATQATRPTEFQ